MSPELQKLIDLLRSQLGYSEQGGGYTKFGSWYGHTVEFDSDYSAQPWCDMFLSWGAHTLGYDTWFGQFAYTVDHAKYFIGKGAWGHTPQPGAVVFFDWSGTGAVDNIDHVGLVTSVDGDTIHTIEGNVDGMFVREKVRDQTDVVGYGYPAQIKQQMAGTILARKTAAEYPLPAGTAMIGVPTWNAGLGGRYDLGAASLPASLLIGLLAVAVCVKVRRRASLRSLRAATGEDRRAGMSDYPRPESSPTP